MMKNLTLRVEEDVLRYARRAAAERDTSLNALVREYLEGLAREGDRRETARRELLDLCRQSEADSGDASWTREELHGR